MTGERPPPPPTRLTATRAPLPRAGSTFSDATDGTSSRLDPDRDRRRPHPRIANIAGTTASDLQAPSGLPPDLVRSLAAQRDRANSSSGSRGRTASSAGELESEAGGGRPRIWGIGGVFPQPSPSFRRRQVENRPQSRTDERADSNSTTERRRTRPPRHTGESEEVKTEKNPFFAEDRPLSRTADHAPPVQPGSTSSPALPFTTTSPSPPTSPQLKSPQTLSSKPFDPLQTIRPYSSPQDDGHSTLAGTVSDVLSSSSRGFDSDSNLSSHITEEDERAEGDDDQSVHGQVGGELNQDPEQWQEDFDQFDAMPVRNTWGRFRYVLREPLAEFLGTVIMILLGIGSNCQVSISEGAAGGYQDQNWSWGFGITSGIYVAGGVSGGHLNPAVTIGLAFFRGFPWRMVPRYVLAQVLGAFIGALIIYGNYHQAIMTYDPNKLIYAESGGNASAALFITVPNASTGGTAVGFGQEVLASAILAVVVLALGDESNAPPGAGLGALVLGFVVTAIGMSNGWISSYAMNPARDFGPRIALWCMGYGTKLWTHDSCWWLVGPICGSLLGAFAGSLMYDLCIFVGPGSPVNFSKVELIHSLRLHEMRTSIRKLGPANRATQKALDAADTEAGFTHAMRKELHKPEPEIAGARVAGEGGAAPKRWRRAGKKVKKEKRSQKERISQAMAEFQETGGVPSREGGVQQVRSI
ncbi:aquaglyceroporin related protein [Pseudohyphozyma bogoriensis]|nr:aquaglyceroporin related protein [Pseudohyphozyma bogoriensis]